MFQMPKSPGVPLARPIEHTELMLAFIRKTPFSDDAWLYELKYDGYRALVRKTGERVELISRNGNCLNGSFPDIVSALAAVPGSFVCDAELTVDDANGRSSFERLQIRARTSVSANVRAAASKHPARLYLFDMLATGKRDIRGLPLVDRKRFLADSFESTKTLIVVSSIVAAGEWVFEQAITHGMEGMVAKRLNSTYQTGRSRDWLKIKHSEYGRPAALGFGRARPVTDK
jgi:bifunctional non-homologous end joining protein LigD